MSVNIERIAKITATLTEDVPDFLNLTVPIGGAAVQIGRGITPPFPSFGVGVYKDQDVAIMRMFTPKDGTIDVHRHSASHVWVGVIRGCIEIIGADTQETVRLNTAEAVHIRPGTGHAFRALEDTVTWAVSLPPADGYPDVTQCPFAGAHLSKLAGSRENE